MGDSRPIGLIAGAGGLPAEACRRLRGDGEEVSVFGFLGITDEIPDGVGGAESAFWTRLGELDRLREALNERGIGRLLIVGAFDRALLKETGERLAPDAEALALLGKILEEPDEPLMVAVADWLSEQGFELLRQDEMLRAMLAPAGELARLEPTPDARRDIEVGISAVRELNPLGSAQAVAVKDGAVVAVESTGTDALIRRAGEAAGAGLTLVKGARRGQDRRLDLPTVGAGTIDVLASVRARALAVEAGATLLVSDVALLRRAEEAGISVTGWTREEGEA